MTMPSFHLLFLQGCVKGSQGQSSDCPVCEAVNAISEVVFAGPMTLDNKRGGYSRPPSWPVGLLVLSSLKAKRAYFIAGN